MNNYHQIFYSTAELPADWNEVAQSSIFLQKEYLLALEQSIPTNLTISYVGIFQENQLVAVAFIQQINLNQLETFGVRDSGLKIMIRDFLFKNYAGKLLIVGNNMLTGQHAMAHRPEIAPDTVLTYLKEQVCSAYPHQHLEIFKDFPEEDLPCFTATCFEKSLRFTSQPSMFFSLKESWKNEQDYVSALSKKYRDQYKRARKKAEGIEKRQLNLSEIIELESRIYELYVHVAKNAPFNTFFLTKNHFSCLKRTLGESFRFFAYFEDGKLIGFNTLFQQKDLLETYFLGYDPNLQKDKMLYLNMLYDMVGCAIVNGFRHIQFGRTAMEIKSSIGAEPINMYGLMEHRNPWINRNLNRFFNFLEPNVKWTQRHPFKDVN